MSRRWKLPRTTNDKIALSVFSFGGVYLLWYELLHILPSYLSQTDWTVGVYIHIISAMYLAHNIYGNMYMLATTDTTGMGVVLPQKLQTGWRYCDKCYGNYPPRSHHCPICDVCVLKRDHHCWFAGYCIGYHNHRYYLALVVNMVIAAVYCNIYNFQYVSEVKDGFGVWTILSLFAPHVGLFFGYYDLYKFFITIQTSIGCLLLFLFTWMLVIQIQQLQFGQTQYEKKKQIKTYNLGFVNNLKSVAGEKWYLIFLSPLIPSFLCGDGLNFPTCSHKSE